jgi:glycerophosphoryl diester phosphodiesterase
MALKAGYWIGLLAALWVSLHLIFRQDRKSELVAHRGAAGEAPENTLAAVEAGMASGAEYLEVDVQRARDGSLIVLHDLKVDRTTSGAGHVQDLGLEQLQALDAGTWFAPQFRGQRVPTLRQVLEASADWKGVLVVEGKSPGRYPGLARDLADALARERRGRVEVVSFDHNWLRRFHALAPEIPTGALFLFPFVLPRPEEATHIGVHWSAPILDPTLLYRAHRRGLKVWVWTVDHPVLQDVLAWLGVDAITTNLPTAAAARWRESPSKE